MAFLFVMVSLFSPFGDSMIVTMVIFLCVVKGNIGVSELFLHVFTSLFPFMALLFQMDDSFSEFVDFVIVSMIIFFSVVE